MPSQPARWLVVCVAGQVVGGGPVARGSLGRLSRAAAGGQGRVSGRRAANSRAPAAPSGNPVFRNDRADDTGIPARKSVFGLVGSQNTLFCAGTTCKRVAPPGPLTSHPWSPPRFHESANHYTLSLPSDPPGHSWRGALATAPSTSDRRRLRAPALGAGTQPLALASSSSAQRQSLALALGAGA